MADVNRNGRPGAVLMLSMLVAGGMCLIIGRAPRIPDLTARGAVPSITPELAFVERGAPIAVRSSHGGALWYATGADPRHMIATHDGTVIPAWPSSRSIARIMAVPPALQWRHPLPGLPQALVVRAAEGEARRSTGPATMRTFLFEGHGALPVISIAAAHDDLFGAGRGIAVVGEAILHGDPAIQASYARDVRWWKYPGNYHGRGREWERPARMQLIDADGRELLQTDVDLRINGQMTRGFPQHAYRLLFREPLSIGPFADGDGRGARSLVLRAAGNDQVKAMLRDAYQHALCADLPFATSKSRSCVLFINGAYFGVHHLRQRFDEDEMVRRFDVPAKRITIIEDKNVVYWGDSTDAKRFARLMARTEKWDAIDHTWIDTLEAQLDLDGFLTYMASQMVMGNMDWPRQNVKYWRYTGKPKAAPLDGRWRFIMGDSDLGFGANAAPTADLFVKVREANVPLSRLFLALLRNPGLKQRFARITTGLIDGPLSPAVCLAKLDSMARLLDPEMERHTARWRKPADKATWLAEVEVMRLYARDRAGHVRQQLATFGAP